MAQKQVGGFVVNIDPKEWYRFKKQLDAVDPKLTAALRKRVKNAGNIGAEKVRATLRMPTPSGNDDGEGRAALEAATKVSVSFSGRLAGAKIRTANSRLDAKHQGLMFVYNKKTFRHPVFETNRQGVVRAFSKGSSRNLLAAQQGNGELAQWVTEQGRPYFGSAILSVMNLAIYDEIYAAFDDATKAIGDKLA